MIALIKLNELCSVIEIFKDVTMVMKGLEIPFFLQNKYEKYSPHFEGLMSILTKGLVQ